MKITKGRIALLLAIAFAVSGWQAWQRYWYYIPGIVAAIKDPVGPPRPVVWQNGPAAPALPLATRPPSIIVILADDLGWNDLSFNGGGVANGAVPTPRINSIGQDGATFMQAYAGNATCAPSRAAIMTGRYATRFGFEFTPAPKQFSRLIGTFPTTNGHPMLYHPELEASVPDHIDQLTVPTSEIMIAQVMKQRAYHTLMLGKWHLGGTPETRPEARGFDEALAFYAGASMFLPKSDPNVVNSVQEFDPIDKFLWANLPFGVRYNGSKQFAPSEYMTEYLGHEAARAIEANKNRPFFMYLAYNAVHTPLQALKSDYDALSSIPDHRLRVYAAMVRALDRSVGYVLDALKSNGLEDNTLVIFTSDNGGAHYIGLPDINKPFRGFKATFFEGGLHVPFFLKWPARIVNKTVYEKPIAHVDIFATSAAAAAISAPQDRVLDGVDLLQFLTGANTAEPHKSLYWRSGDYKVVLSGNWKLQMSELPNKVWLFDLATDPTEQNNLATANAAKLSELLAELKKVDNEQSRPSWPSLLQAPILIDKPMSVPAKPDDEYINWAN